MTLIQSLQRGGWVSGTASKISSHRPLLPFLQQIDETWDPINDCTSNSKFLPKVMVPTLSGDTVDSYFYDATRDGAKKVQLQKFASKCTCPVGKLLLEYFWYYGFVFQWRRQVVSIRKESVVLKHEKARDHGWKRNGQLSIADPFEIGYNVAHVLRPNTNKRVRDEFVRAYCILAGIGQQDVSPNLLYQSYLKSTLNLLKTMKKYKMEIPRMAQWIKMLMSARKGKRFKPRMRRRALKIRKKIRDHRRKIDGIKSRREERRRIEINY